MKLWIVNSLLRVWTNLKILESLCLNAFWEAGSPSEISVGRPQHLEDGGLSGLRMRDHETPRFLEVGTCYSKFVICTVQSVIQLKSSSCLARSSMISFQHRLMQSPGDVCRTELSELVGEGVGLLACVVRQIWGQDFWRDEMSNRISDSNVDSNSNAELQMFFASWLQELPERISPEPTTPVVFCGWGIGTRTVRKIHETVSKVSKTWTKCMMPFTVVEGILHSFWWLGWGC